MVPQAGVLLGEPHSENVRQIGLQPRVTRDQPEEVATRDLDRSDVRARNDAGGAWPVGDDADLTDHVPRVEAPDGGGARIGDRGHEHLRKATFQDQDAVARLALSADQLTGSVTPRVSAGQDVGDRRAVQSGEERRDHREGVGASIAVVRRPALDHGGLPAYAAEPERWDQPACDLIRIRPCGA